MRAAPPSLAFHVYSFATLVSRHLCVVMREREAHGAVLAWLPLDDSLLHALQVPAPSSCTGKLQSTTGCDPLAEGLHVSLQAVQRYKRVTHPAMRLKEGRRTVAVRVAVLCNRNLAAAVRGTRLQDSRGSTSCLDLALTRRKSSWVSLTFCAATEVERDVWNQIQTVQYRIQCLM